MKNSRRTERNLKIISTLVLGLIVAGCGSGESGTTDRQEFAKAPNASTGQTALSTPSPKPAGPSAMENALSQIQAQADQQAKQDEARRNHALKMQASDQAFQARENSETRKAEAVSGILQLLQTQMVMTPMLLSSVSPECQGQALSLFDKIVADGKSILAKAQEGIFPSSDEGTVATPPPEGPSNSTPSLSNATNEGASDPAQMEMPDQPSHT